MNNETAASQALIEAFFRLHPGEAARALAASPVPEALRLLEAGEDVPSAQVFERLDPDRAVELVEAMDAGLFRRLWQGIDPGVGSSLLSRLEEAGRAHRLAVLPERLAVELKELMRYPAESAGSLMDTAVTVFSSDETAGEALDRIRSFPERRLHDLCVVDSVAA